MRGFWMRAGVLAVLAMLATAGSASGATVEVTRTGDPVPGACTKKDCSLREAVRRANQTSGVDRIVLKAKTYRLTRVGDDDDALAGDLDVLGGSGRLTIVGRGAGKSRIEGNGVDRVLHVLENGRLALRRLTLTGGAADFGGGMRTEVGSSTTLARTAVAGNAGDGFGGGIFTNLDSKLTIERSVFRGNTSSTFGGALFHNNESDVRIVRSRFRGNKADYGGAIYNQNDATMLVKGSTFERNRAIGSEGGGAIFNQNSAHALIVGSTISNNRALNDGGGIYAKNRSTMSIVNSTISRNKADRGGGIFVRQQGKVDVSYATIAGNRALTAGGGVFDEAVPPGPPAPPYLTFRGTIIAGNVAPGATNNCVVDDPGNWLSLGSNLENKNSCQFTRGSDQRSARAGLRRLARNGGPTKTHALKRSSDAVNAARRKGCPRRDQRGVKRPQGRRCDTGSYELKRR